jgi:hypothetical protein
MFSNMKHVTAWSKTVWKAMLRGGAEYQRQKAMNRAVANWSKTFLNSTNIGRHKIGHAASTGTQGDLMDHERWEWRCMLQFREGKNWKPTNCHDLGS